MSISEKALAPSARRIVLIVFFLCGSMIGLWASRIPDLKAAAGLSESGFGLLLLVMATGALTSFPLAGALIDRKGAVLVTKVLLLATVLAFLAVGYAPSTPVLAVCFFFAGFTIGALDVAMNAWGAEIETVLERPIMTSFHGLYSLGAGMAAQVGGLAIKADLSISTHFTLWCLLTVPALVLTLRQSWTSAKGQQSTEGKAPIFALPKGALVFVGLVAMVAAMGEGAVTDWAALYQIQDLGYSDALAPTAFTIFSVAMVIMRLSGDRVVARFGPVPVARASGLVAFFGCVLLVWASSVWFVWAGAFVMGLGYAVLFPLAMSRAAAETTISKGAALASVATFGYGAFLLGPPLLGFIGDAFTLRASFAAVAVFTLALPFLAVALRVRS